MDKLRHKEILLQTFQDFVSFCDKHNIKYVAAYGTVLGAIRHKGLIPWDDDIDVFMDRKDYNRFVSLKSELIDTNYEILDIDNDGYYLPFAKFCNKNTTIIENKDIPFIIGVFVDIFPLDKTFDSDSQAYNLYSKFRKKWSYYSNTLYRFSYSNLISLLCRREYRGLLLVLYSFICSFIKPYLKNNYVNTVEKLSYIQGNKYIDYTGSKFWLHSMDIISNTIEVPFENILIKVPQNYEEYLTKTYGNWKELPPVNKRVSHPCHFINLEKRLNLEDICDK